MITPQEIRAVPIFAQLGDAEVERLAKRSADVPTCSAASTRRTKGSVLPSS